MEDNVNGYLYVMNYETCEIIEIPYLEEYATINNIDILALHNLNYDVCDTMYSEHRINKIIPIKKINNE